MFCSQKIDEIDGFESTISFGTILRQRKQSFQETEKLRNFNLTYQEQQSKRISLSQILNLYLEDPHLQYFLDCQSKQKNPSLFPIKQVSHNNQYKKQIGIHEKDNITVKSFSTIPSPKRQKNGLTKFSSILKMIQEKKSPSNNHKIKSYQIKPQVNNNQYQIQDRQNLIKNKQTLIKNKHTLIKNKQTFIKNRQNNQFQNKQNIHPNLSNQINQNHHSNDFQGVLKIQSKIHQPNPSSFLNIFSNQKKYNQLQVTNNIPPYIRIPFKKSQKTKSLTSKSIFKDKVSPNSGKALNFSKKLKKKTLNIKKSEGQESEKILFKLQR